jgi:hypothetical protein
MYPMAIIATAAAVTAGCGPAEESVVGGSLHDDARQTLDACSLPETCTWPDDPGAQDPTPYRCIVAELEAGRGLLAATFITDGGDCGTEARLYVGTSGRAYFWQRSDRDCSAADDISYQLERCERYDTGHYTTCLAAMDSYQPGDPLGIPCSIVTDWVTACTPTEQVDCQ